jgi:hypothetical protein
MGLVTKHGKPPISFQTFVLRPRLKEFLKRFIAQSIVYKWFVAQHHNINNYLDKIQWEARIVVDLARILGKESCTKNTHFLNSNPKKPIFHNNLSFLFSKYSYAHVGNTLLVDDTPYTSLFNGSFNVICVETFEKSRRDDNYLLGTVFTYMEIFIFWNLVFPLLFKTTLLVEILNILSGMILYTKHYLKVVLVVVIHHIVQM